MREWLLRASAMIAAALLVAGCKGSEAVGPEPPEIEIEEIAVDLSGNYLGKLYLLVRDTVCTVVCGGWAGCAGPDPNL